MHYRIDDVAAATARWQATGGLRHLRVLSAFREPAVFPAERGWP
jgi:hypothetical protein